MESHKALSRVLSSLRVEKKLEEETCKACFPNLQITQGPEEKVAPDGPLTVRELGWNKAERGGVLRVFKNRVHCRSTWPRYAWSSLGTAQSVGGSTSPFPFLP